MPRWYITFFPHHWGRGNSPTASKKAAIKAGGRGTNWYTVRLPLGASDPYVNNLGMLYWHGVGANGPLPKVKVGKTYSGPR